MALNATRYMHQFGVTNEDFGRAVVQLRDVRGHEPRRLGYERPITLADHQASRWIAEPCIRMFDCCQETDGAIALVITSARTGRRPAAFPRWASRPWPARACSNRRSRPTTTGPTCRSWTRRSCSPSACSTTPGIRRDDIDVAMIYDAFSPILLMQLEALGFCGFGEAKDFVADGNLAPDGALPCNTNGGLIGEGYIHGLNLVTEAVRQLRGTAANQLPSVDVALVSASRTGAILTRA